MRYFRTTILLIITTISLSTLADALPDGPHVSVTGSAKIEVQPDQVTIQFQATSLEKTAGLAKQNVDQQVAALLTNLEKAGFDTKVLERGNINTRAQYQYVKDQRILQGIAATRDLTYLLTELEKVNQFLELVVAANIESIGQMNYGLQAPQEWQLKVRQLAIQDSKEKAENLASAYQAKLGKIYAINYQHSYAQPLMMRAKSDQMAESTYQVNKINISDQVQVVFTLK
ncbi:MAG TPA: SIMPL domain-containing protein [Psychromonas sp.]